MFSAALMTKVVEFWREMREQHLEFVLVVIFLGFFRLACCVIFLYCCSSNL